MIDNIENDFNFNHEVANFLGNNVKIPIRVIENSETYKYLFVSKDELDNVHFVCETELYRPRNRAVQSGTYTIPSSPAEPDNQAINIREDAEDGTLSRDDLTPTQLERYNLVQGESINLRAQNVEGVSAEMSYILPNGAVTKGNSTEPSCVYRFLGDENNKTELIQAHLMPILAQKNPVNFNTNTPGIQFHNIGIKYSSFPTFNYVNVTVRIIFVHTETLRRYSSPGLFAAWLGHLAEVSYNSDPHEASNSQYTGVQIADFLYEDNTCYPSVSHDNGAAVDRKYLTNLATQNTFCIALRDMGFERHGSYADGASPADWKQNIGAAVGGVSLNGHKGHLHSDHYRQRFIYTFI